MKFGLFLVGSKGQQVLENIVEDLDIKFVLSYNDKEMFDNSFYLIKEICLGRKIPFFEGKILPPEEYEKVDKIFVIGWQFLLKENFDKLIVIHDSKLPEFKGWSPTINYLIQGSSYLGVTAFKPTEKMDTGDIYYQRTIEIKYPIKINEAINLVSQLYVDIIKIIVISNPKPYLMKGNESFCIWRNHDDYFINWNNSAEEIKRFVDAVGYPYAGAKFMFENNELTVIDCEVVDDIKIIGREIHVGKFLKLIDQAPIIICGHGLIKLTKVVDNKNIEFKFNKLKIKL